MRAEITTDGGIRAGTPTSKFPAPSKAPWRDFLPLPDGRVLAIVTDSLARDQPMTVITNAVR